MNQTCTQPEPPQDAKRLLLAEFEILGLPKTINAIGRKHWAVKVKEARRWKLMVYAQCVIKGITELNLIKCELEFIRHSLIEPDFDNLAGSFKHVLDGLVYAQVIKDDKPSIIGSPKFSWEKAKRGHGKITVRIFT